MPKKLFPELETSIFVSSHVFLMYVHCAILEPYQLLSFFQASIPDRSHYRPGWQRNPTLVKMHEKHNEGNVLNGSRIVGGTEVIPHSFPHQVAMFIDGSFFCGGSLICKQF